jgi:RNA polymerase sigma-70 factor (ECF subfamily)
MSTIIWQADLDSWYRAYAVKLRSVAWRIVGNRDDAEDATQEAFIAALRAIDRYDGSDPYPWLYRIATRKALTIASARRPVTGLPEAADDAGPAVPSAEDEALARLRSKAIRTLVAGEPAVALHVGGLRFREIGERFGVPPATAASRIRRGKRRLRSQLRATLATLPESQPA